MSRLLEFLHISLFKRTTWPTKFQFRRIIYNLALLNFIQKKSCKTDVNNDNLVIMITQANIYLFRDSWYKTMQPRSQAQDTCCSLSVVSNNSNLVWWSILREQNVLLNLCTYVYMYVDVNWIDGDFNLREGASPSSTDKLADCSGHRI